MADFSVCEDSQNLGS